MDTNTITCYIIYCCITILLQIYQLNITYAGEFSLQGGREDVTFPIPSDK